MNANGEFALRPASNGVYPMTCADPTGALAQQLRYQYHFSAPQIDPTVADYKIYYVGPIVFTNETFLAEYQQPAGGGYMTKFRSYKLFAKLSPDESVYGPNTFQFERDVIIYFDIPNQAWKISSDTIWHPVGSP